MSRVQTTTWDVDIGIHLPLPAFITQTLTPHLRYGCVRSKILKLMLSPMRSKQPLKKTENNGRISIWVIYTEDRAEEISLLRNIRSRITGTHSETVG